MTRYSLAEIEAQSRKAARGAGYAWGLAEEAGKAARWLAAHGLPGLDILAAFLKQQDDCDYGRSRPRDPASAFWEADDALCPIIAGAAFSDFGAATLPVTLKALRYPLLILPYVATASISSTFRVTWKGTQALCQSNGLVVEGPVDTAQADVVIETASTVEPTYRFNPQSCNVSDAAWATLDHFAHRTYVPATEASRSGAGAGETDND